MPILTCRNHWWWSSDGSCLMVLPFKAQALKGSLLFHLLSSWIKESMAADYNLLLLSRNLIATSRGVQHSFAVGWHPFVTASWCNIPHRQYEIWLRNSSATSLCEVRCFSDHPSLAVRHNASADMAPAVKPVPPHLLQFWCYGSALVVDRRVHSNRLSGLCDIPINA